MRRASTPRADSLLVGIFRCCSVSFLLCIHFGFFKCEDNFTDVVGMWWLLTSSGSVTAGPAQDVCVAVERKCSGRWGRRCLVTQKGLTVGFTVVAGDFEERMSVEGEAELDVTQRFTPTVSFDKNAVGVLLVGSGWAGAVAGAAVCVTENTHRIVSR